METTAYKYDVYISYADFPRDKRIAAKLQKLLQRHRTKETARNGNGKKHARRLQVFRRPSRAALDAKSDEASRQALAQSRYMVFLCSNASKESELCQKELELFRKQHGESNEHILLLLLEGNPSEVFPEQLRREQPLAAEAGSQEKLWTEKAEPLAANIAGAHREMTRLLRREYLRLAAPVLGCGFDELYQRKQRKQRQQFQAVFAAVLAASLCFWGYSSHMLKQLAEKQKELDANEALRLASQSEEVCKKGDYRLAMLLAEQAMYMDKNEPGTLLAAQAETALRSAVTGQMIAKDKPLILQASISFNVTDWFICNTYAEGTRIAVSDYDNTYLYDTMTGKLLFQCQGTEVYFDEGAEEAVRITDLFDGEETVLRECFQVQTGKLLSSEKLQKGSYKLPQDCGSYRNPAFASVTADADYLADETMQPDTNGAENDAKQLVIEEMKWAKAQLEKIYLLTVRAGIDAGDGELFIYFDSLHPAGNFFWSRREMRVVAFLYGDCYFDRASHLIYQANGTELCIYSYAPENFGTSDLTDCDIRISRDGKRLLTSKTLKIDEGIYQTFLQVLDTNSLSSSVLEAETIHEGYFVPENPLYYMTPNMDKIFYEDAEGMLCLKEAGGEVILSFRPEPGQKAIGLSIDEDGRRLAAAMKQEDGTVRVDLLLADGSPAGRLDLTEYGDISVSHMEFGKDCLLISTLNESMLFDLTGKNETKIFEHGNQGFHQDRYLTEDGLLFCTMETNSYYCLCAICDIETGAELFREGDICRAYQYREDTGTLVYQKLGTANMNKSVYIARRSADGIFEDVRTVTTQETNMMLRIDDCTMDGRYFVINGDDCCEVYDIFSGDRSLTCNGTGYALIEGVLYNLNEYTQDCMAQYPIMDIDELKEQADRYLTSENGMRELTEWEREIYFISADSKPV